MSIRFAFIGFRHFHIDELYAFVKKHPGTEITAAVEDDTDSVPGVKERGIELTGTSVDEIFRNGSTYDAVAIGDYYGRRGSLAIRALEAGKHVIVDKPLCTSCDELLEIDRLRQEQGLAVGCMLNNRDSGVFRTVKRLIGEGAIGNLQTINFMGQHPMLFGTRPEWYFEKGKHGGTMNDIGIHAFDIIPWMCGIEWRRVIGARTWNTRLPERPHFQVGAQVMLELEDQTGVIGDMSYLSPDSQGYTVPQYWRYTIHGTEGIIEAGMKLDDIRIWKNGGDAVEIVTPEADRIDGVYEDFLREVNGEIDACDLTSDQVIDSSRVTLTIQQASDRHQFPQELS